MKDALIQEILQLSGDMPNAAQFQHYLEQLPTPHVQQKLADLRASEQRHAGRWYGGADIQQPQLNRARLGLVATI